MTSNKPGLNRQAEVAEAVVAGSATGRGCDRHGNVSSLLETNSAEDLGFQTPQSDGQTRRRIVGSRLVQISHRSDRGCVACELANHRFAASRIAHAQPTGTALRKHNGTFDFEWEHGGREPLCSKGATQLRGDFTAPLVAPPVVGRPCCRFQRNRAYRECGKRAEQNPIAAGEPHPSHPMPQELPRRSVLPSRKGPRPFPCATSRSPPGKAPLTTSGRCSNQTSARPCPPRRRHSRGRRGGRTAPPRSSTAQLPRTCCARTNMARRSGNSCSCRQTVPSSLARACRQPSQRYARRAGAQALRTAATGCAPRSEGL